MQLKFQSLLCFAALSVGACADLGGGPATAPVQPTQEQLGPDRFGRYIYRVGGNPAFKSATTGQRGAVGIEVEVDEIKGQAPGRQKIYYTVEMDIWAAESFGRDNGLARSFYDALPDALLEDVYHAISQKAQSNRMIELAALVAKHSICVDGTSRTDDRNIKRASLSPAQSARVNSTFGGNPADLLGKSQQDLKRLGLGDAISRGKPIPAIDYDRFNAGYVDVHMMCDLK